MGPSYNLLLTTVYAGYTAFQQGGYCHLEYDYS